MSSTFTAKAAPGGATATGRAVGVCPACGTGLATDERAPGSVGKCGHCGERVTLRLVYGANSDVPCDSRCEGAIGPSCSCSCGGANHGRLFLDIRLVPVFEREKAAKAQAKARAAHGKREAAKVQKAKDARAAQLAEFESMMTACPELAELLGEDYAGRGHGFISDIRAALEGKHPLTSRQIETCLWIVKRDRERAARQAKQKSDRDTRDTAARAAGVKVPAGRVTFTGEIVKAELRDQNAPTYGGRSTYKIMVVTPQGWRVWGSAPRAILPGVISGGGERVTDMLRGRVVTMSAEIKPSADDQLFGFYSRPTSARLHEHGETPPQPTTAPAPAAVPAPRTAPQDVPDVWAAFLSTVA